MDAFTDEQRGLLAAAVERARLDLGWGKEEAARHAHISSITWKRVEDGQRVQATKLRAIEIALGWGGGSMDRVARGRPVVVADNDNIEQIRSRGWADRNDTVIWDGFRAATQYANDCEARGANPQLVKDFIGDAVALLNEVGRIRAHPDESSLLSRDEYDVAGEAAAARVRESQGKALRSDDVPPDELGSETGA